MIKIEEGKFYRNRRGEKRGPMCFWSDDEYPWHDGRLTYEEDGHWLITRESEFDLIEEWTDEPKVYTVILEVGPFDTAEEAKEYQAKLVDAFCEMPESADLMSTSDIKEEGT